VVESHSSDLDEIKSNLRSYSKKYEVDEEPTVQPDGSLSISIRDWDLPKEQPEEYPQDDEGDDDEGMNWGDYRDLVKETIKKHTEALLRRLPPGTSVGMNVGDKNYLEVTVRPPKAKPTPAAPAPADKSASLAQAQAAVRAAVKLFHPAAEGKPAKKSTAEGRKKMIFGKPYTMKGGKWTLEVGTT
jgi:hypothetical protein